MIKVANASEAFVFLQLKISREDPLPSRAMFNLVTRIERSSSNLINSDHFIENPVYYMNSNLASRYSEEVEQMTDRCWIHMVKKWTGLFMGALIVLALAACGNYKTDQTDKSDGSKYKFNLLTEDSDTYIEFVISNVNDPEINAENVEAGEL